MRNRQTLFETLTPPRISGISFIRVRWRGGFCRFRQGLCFQSLDKGREVHPVDAYFHDKG